MCHSLRIASLESMATHVTCGSPEALWEIFVFCHAQMILIRCKSSSGIVPGIAKNLWGRPLGNPLQCLHRLFPKSKHFTTTGKKSNTLRRAHGCLIHASGPPAAFVHGHFDQAGATCKSSKVVESADILSEKKHRPMPMSKTALMNPPTKWQAPAHPLATPGELQNALTLLGRLLAGGAGVWLSVGPAGENVTLTLPS